MRAQVWIAVGLVAVVSAVYAGWGDRWGAAVQAVLGGVVLMCGVVAAVGRGDGGPG
jgi:hypothetical protein